MHWLLKINVILLLIAYESDGWKAMRMSALSGKIWDEDDKDIKSIHNRKAIIHTRYKYNLCHGRQLEVYNKTVYKGLIGHRVIYFEVQQHRPPRCVILSIYVPPRMFLKPARYLVNLCLGMIAFIRRKALHIFYLMEFSFELPIPENAFMVVGVRMGSTS